MNDIEFYNLFKYISDHQNTVALININEFKRLVKIRGEYKFMPFKIMMLEALFFNDGDKMAAASKRERHLS